MSKPIAAKYKGPKGLVYVNGMPLDTNTVVTEPPDAVAELCTRGDCVAIYEDAEALEDAADEDQDEEAGEQE